MAEVGVVVPVRDGERHLAAALASIAAQEGVTTEVVVVDDGSTDASGRIAADAGARVLALSGGSGAGAARNAGVAALDTEWLAFLDADDEWTPDRLRVGLAAFAADPALDVCFAHAETFGAGEPEVVPGLLPGTLLVRRTTWDRVGPLAEVRAGELMDWLLRARDLGLRETMLPDVVLRRRLHDANSTRDRERLSDYTHVLKAALDRRRAQARS